MRILLIALLCCCFICVPFLASAENNLIETPYIPFNDSFYNPFMATANDPWLIRNGKDIYYSTHLRLYHVHNITGIMADIANPACLKNLTALPDQTEIWAPEIHYYQGHWYYFYAADYENDNIRHRMYVIKSKTDDPMGEWNMPVKLDLPEDQWSIDGTFFEYKDGRIFFIWSGWRDEAQGSSMWKQYLYIVELETGDPTRVKSTERVQISKPRYYWEMSVQPQNEGPSVIVSPNGTYYCMYAANYSASNEYVVAGIRLNGDPLDATAWEKLKKPVLQTNDEAEIYAPGHASFIKSPDGTEDWIVFHTAKSDLSGWSRNGRAQKIEWIDDTPVAGTIIPNDELIPLPSGEIVDRICIQLENCELSGNFEIQDSMTTSPAVIFSDPDARACAVISAPEDGLYALYLRHNSITHENSVVWVKTVGSENETALTATWSNSDHQFIIDCVLVNLQKGLNSVEIRTQQALAIDLLVFDRTPVRK